MKNSWRRSLAKAVSWKSLSTVVTFLLIYLFTGQVALAVGVGLIDLGIKTVLFFAHEQVWEHYTRP